MTFIFNLFHFLCHILKINVYVCNINDNTSDTNRIQMVYKYDKLKTKTL